MVLPVADRPPIPERFEGAVRLGGEGEAMTFAAFDREQAISVVVKVLDVKRMSDWNAFDRFERECAVIESLDHPQVPRHVEHFYDESTGRYLLVMERIEGATLAEALACGRRWSEAELLGMLDQMLDILEYLHGLHPPVIHRDIKPSNIIVDRDGRMVLVDFGGVGRAYNPEGSPTVVGTFGYMAPEQLYGRVTPACDIYALGATWAALSAGVDAERLPRRGLAIDLHEVISAGPLRTRLEAMVQIDPDRRPVSVSALRACAQGGDGEVARRHSRGDLHSTEVSLGQRWSGLTPGVRVGVVGYVWVTAMVAGFTRSLFVVVPLLILPLFFFAARWNKK